MEVAEQDGDILIRHTRCVQLRAEALQSAAGGPRSGQAGEVGQGGRYVDLAHLAVNLPKCVEFFDKTAAELAR